MKLVPVRSLMPVRSTYVVRGNVPNVGIIHGIKNNRKNEKPTKVTSKDMKQMFAILNNEGN